MRQFAALTAVNRFVHEPVRLAILTILAGYGSVDADFLQHELGVSRAALANHVSRLIAAGLVYRVPQTDVPTLPVLALTEAGRVAVEEHWQHLETAWRHAQFALARRFLNAPEGSDEQALTGAALSDAVAREEGHRVSPGGDARVVFARLRQRQQPYEPH